MSKYRIRVRTLIESGTGRLKEVYEVQMKLFGLIWIELDYFWCEEGAQRYLRNKKYVSQSKTRYIE